MSSQMTHHQLLRWVTNIIAQKMLTKFYGTISFRFEAGKVIHCKTEFTEKPSIDGMQDA
jgi:hypothetical protein